MSSPNLREAVVIVTGPAAASDAVCRWNGQCLVTAALAQTCGFTDVDGRSPPPLTIVDV